MGTILNSAAAPTPPAGELLTFAAVDGIGLWCSYLVDDNLVGLSHAWINGQWVTALALFGHGEHFGRWFDAVEAAAVGEAVARAAEVAESLPAFDAALVRAETRAALGVDLLAFEAMDDTLSAGVPA